MATTAEQLVQLLKNTNSFLNLINDLPQFRDGLDNLVGRLEKAERALAAQDKRITALEPVSWPAPNAGA
jgi:hypothetical protein